MEFEGACSKKMEGNPVAAVEALIHINNQLHQHEVCCFHSFKLGYITCLWEFVDICYHAQFQYPFKFIFYHFFLQAAVGILTYSQQHLDVQLKESWCV